MSVNRSSYYKWKSSNQSSKEIQDELLATQILEYHESFDGILGYRRMTEYINHFNKTNYSWKYIRRIMRKLGIKARIRQRNLIIKKLNLNKLEKIY